jgi:hypothetical protein
MYRNCRVINPCVRALLFVTILIGVVGHVTPAFGQAPFGADWASSDVGNVGQPGTATKSNGVWTVRGAGADIWGDADAFQFLHAPFRVDGHVVVRVNDLQNTNPFAKAGLMVRADLTATAATVILDVKPNSEVEFMERPSTGAAMTYVTGTPVTLPAWLQLSWIGNTFTASVSQDGQSFTTIGATTVVMPEVKQVGAIVTSHDVNHLNTAHFERLSLLPAGWTSTDIGKTGLPGSALFGIPDCFCNENWRVEGAGADVWGAADSLQFVHRTVSGDFDMSWDVLSLDNTHPFAKAGLMVRDGLAPDAVNLILDAKPNGEIEFMARECVGCNTQYLAGATAVFPFDLYVQRNGSTFNAYVNEYAGGGGVRRLVGSVTLPVGNAVELGFAVTSHDTARLANARFDHPDR